MDLSSEELLVQVATGDKRAFGELYDRLAARVMGICMQVLRNRAIAEEITQEVFVEIWRTAPMFSPERGSAQGWVLRLARSRAIDKLRSRMAALARDERTTMLEQLTRYIDVEEDAITSVEGEQLRAAVNAIMLTYFGGLTQQQLADHLGIPLGTAKTRVRDGLKKLKSALHVTNKKEA